MKTKWFLKVALFSLSIGVPVNAGIIVNTFGPGDSYETDSAYGVNSGLSIAAPFTPTTNQTLSEVAIALSTFSVPRDFDVTVRSDSGGLPGAVLQIWTVSLSGISFLTPGSPVNLSAGAQYWVVAESSVSTLLGGWNVNDQGLQGPFAFSVGGGFLSVSQILPAYRVTGVDIAVVPEPGTVLFGAGTTLMVILRRRWARSI